MALKLDTRFPLVWRNPSSIQFGIDEPSVILDHLTGADERMIAALVVGVSRSGLSMIGGEAGATEPDIDRLLDRLQPALAPGPQNTASLDGEAADPDVPPTVSLIGSGPTIDRLTAALCGSGIRVVAGRDDPAGIGLAVMVAHYVLDPELHGFWLRRDIPHLPVVFGDLGVQLGPIIEPGSGPCLYCIERHRSDADPAWPAIASQLWGRRSPVETPLVSHETAALTARLVLARLGGGADGGQPDDRPHRTGARSIRLDAASGAISRLRWTPHPACGCLVLPENATASGPRRDAIPTPPTTTAGSPGHG